MRSERGARGAAGLLEVGVDLQQARYVERDPERRRTLARQVAEDEQRRREEASRPGAFSCLVCDGARFVLGRKTGDGKMRVEGMPDPVREVLPCPNCADWKPGELLARAGIPERYTDASFATFRTESGKGQALEAVREWVEATAAGGFQSLMLRGANGRGKTHLAVSAVRELCDRGVPSRFVQLPDLLERVRAGFGDGTADRIVTAMTNVRVLVLDDLGAARPTDWVLERVPSLLEARLMAMRPTVITSDKGADWLVDAGYDARFISRLGSVRDFTHVEVGGVDMRRVA